MSYKPYNIRAEIYIFIFSLDAGIMAENVILFALEGILFETQSFIISLSAHQHGIYRVVEFQITIIIISKQPIYASIFPSDISIKAGCNKQLYLSHGL